MTILRFLFFVFLLYLAFRLIFDFIIPVYKTTKRVKQGFREMQDRMNQHAEQHNRTNRPTEVVNQNKKAENEDYIDFEEIK